MKNAVHARERIRGSLQLPGFYPLSKKNRAILTRRENAIGLELGLAHEMDCENQD